MKTKIFAAIKLLALAIWMLYFSINLSAQDKESIDKIERARVTYINEQLKLTPEQAEKFWPLYREYADRRKGLQDEFRNAVQNLGPDATEDDKKRVIEMGTQLKQRGLDMERDYSDRLMRVINAQQMLNLRQAEENFRLMLLRRVEQRQQMENRREQNRENLQNRGGRPNNN
ncbi:MAG TPA: hypothetical protein PKC24_14230 [Cyclobacteriaceae bacterium]|nr:hypothetical protein [Cyclobacteriaceae bacterium]